MFIYSGFQSAALTEASEARAAELASHGRIDELAVSLFDAASLSFVLPGKKGASPKGAHATYAKLAAGPKPVFSKDVREAMAGTVKGWPQVCQGLHALVGMLHAAGACDAPAALPAWADPVALAAAKAASAEKRAANKATADAGDAADSTDTDSADAAPAAVNGAKPAATAPAANLIAAAIKAKAYSAADLRVILDAMAAVHAITADDGAFEEVDSAVAIENGAFEAAPF